MILDDEHRGDDEHGESVRVDDEHEDNDDDGEHIVDQLVDGLVDADVARRNGSLHTFEHIAGEHADRAFHLTIARATRRDWRSSP